MARSATAYVRIAVTMDDGTLSIMSFITRGASPALPYGAQWDLVTTDSWMREPSEANILAELSKAFRETDNNGLPLPQPVRWALVEEKDLPTDRTYRNAWRHTKELGFHHDLAHAARLHLALVREARAVEFEQLDRDWMKFTGQGKTAEAEAVEAKRQALRDAPQTLPIDSVQTVEELKALWPKELARQ